MPRRTERIGIIFVHGIGEQRRFEHLDTEIRPFIDALRRRKSLESLTIEILAGESSTLRADQDTWSAQPVRALVGEGGRETEIFFHEVWWADVNEPYSLWKQINFWFWGLSIWAFPNRSKKLSRDDVMENPYFPKPQFWTSRVVARLRLLLVCNIFLMGAFTIGILSFLAKRLMNFAPPKFVRIFVNYVSSVKLYVQRERSDGGFLDAYGEPPRVSIRRRMIRTLTDVSLANYDRWYIFAHSLGSVVAQNGLMENAHALPNYLDEKRWQRLNGRDLAGLARDDVDMVGKHRRMIPARPAWLPWEGVVYRDRLFKKFRGLLTYGSPLDKFAAIWPDRVRINVKEKAFNAKAEWINVFDPTDPVGANLDAFSTDKAELKPVNYGFSAFPVLLYSHLRYMTGKRNKTDRMSDRLAEWVLSGNPFSLLEPVSRWRWFKVGAPTWWVRHFISLFWIVFSYLSLSLGAGFVWWYLFGDATPEQKPGPTLPSPSILDQPGMAWLRKFVEQDWPPIRDGVVHAADKVAGWVMSFPPTRIFFHAIGQLAAWIGSIFGATFDYLHACGKSLSDAIKAFADYFMWTGGNIVTGILGATEYLFVVMGAVLAVTIGMGALASLMWFVQLKRRAAAGQPAPDSGQAGARAGRRRRTRRPTGDRRRAAA